MSVNEEPEVTFVGGKAVEQTEGLDSNLETDEREAAKAAVRKAIKEAEGKGPKEAKEPKREPKEAKEEKPSLERETPEPKAKAKEPEEKESSGPQRGADGKFIPKGSSGERADSKANVAKEDSGGESEEPEFNPEKASLKEMLKNREKVASFKRDQQAATQAQKQADELRQKQEEFQRQQYEFQRRQQEFQRQQQSWQGIQRDPARAVREAGYDPEQFIMDLANEGTPEGKAQRQIREMQRQIQEMNDWRSQQAEQAKRWQQQQERQQKIDYRERATKTFVEKGMDEEKYPHVSNFYKGQERALIAYGDAVEEEYVALTGRNPDSFESILDYIEDQLANKAKAWYAKVSNTGKNQKPVEEEPKPKSKGKSLSPDASGERRALKPQRPSDEDDAERLERAKQEVAVALANSK